MNPNPSLAQIAAFANDLAIRVKAAGAWEADDAETLALTIHELRGGPTPDEIANLIQPGCIEVDKLTNNPLVEIAEWMRDMGERLDDRGTWTDDDAKHLAFSCDGLILPPTRVGTAEASILAMAGVAREADLQRREGYNPN